MSLSKALFLFVLLAFSQARAGEALWTHQFSSESGFPQSLSSAVNATPNALEKKTLVLFWAGWCLPCKGELADLVRVRAEIPKNLKIVAVNVDDPSGLPLAQAFLTSIQWPYEVLRDTSGQFFFEYNHSGQLPFSVLLDEQGLELKSFQKLSDADIKEIEGLVSTSAVNNDQKPAAESGEPVSSYGIHSESVDFTGNNGIHNRMSTETAFARVDSKKWTGQVQYDYMYEELNQPSTVVRGDEIGYSYLEYHDQIGAGQANVRLGDSHQALLSGELLNLQNIPNQTDPASLRGASAQWAVGDWSVSGFAGEIHPALFASPINPTTDLALPVPGETASGASVFWHHDNGDMKNQINLDWVSYHRDVNSDLGDSTAVDQERLGAEIYHSSGKSGIQVRAADFSNDTGIQGVDADRPYIFDPYLWWSPEGHDHQVYTFHYIEYQSLPVRTLTPVLVENPALPLQAAKIRSFRLSTKLSDDSDSVWFEPIWIFEEAFDLLPYERQNTFGFNLSLPKQDRKLLVFYQDGILSPTSPYQEESLLATSPLYGPLSAQLLLRHHQADPLGGDSDGLNLALDLSRMWALPFKGKFVFSGQWTKQSGYYFGFSGISRTDLLSSHLEWTNGVNTVRLGVGSEPGGIVCTNGVCVQKPPLDGADLEFAFNF